MKRQHTGVRVTAYILFCLTGILFFFCCLTGGKLAAEGNIVWTGGYTLRTLALSLFGGGLLGSAICAFWGRVDRKLCGQRQNACEKRKVKLWKIFAGSLSLTVLAWFPAYLSYYPAICAYDMPIQTGQIAEGHYVDHHPLFHTFLLKGFMELGDRLSGSVNTGIGILAFLQLLFLASAFACGVAFLYWRRVRGLWVVLTQFACMFYPFHWYMSVSITKDTVFTGFFVLMILALYRLLVLGESVNVRCRLEKELCFFFAALGMILFRNNGKYAFLVLLAVLCVSFLFWKADRLLLGRLLLWAAGAFAAGSLLLAAIFRASGAEQGDRREMLSMPIQQLARTMLYHGGAGALPEDDGTMDEEDRALIGDFILDEGYKEYDPGISDPVKRHTNTYVVRYRPKDFLKTYLGLLVEYPGDYLNAALAVDAGYLYPGDVSHAYINVSDDRVGRGYVQTYWEEDTMNARGIYKASRWKWLYERLERWADENAYLKLPVLKYLFVPGVWFWFYLLLLARLVMKKRYRECIPLALIGGYFLTLFLGPTVQLRYIYPVMAAFPFVLFGACGREPEEAGCVVENL